MFGMNAQASAGTEHLFLTFTTTTPKVDLLGWCALVLSLFWVPHTRASKLDIIALKIA